MLPVGAPAGLGAVPRAGRGAQVVADLPGVHGRRAAAVAVLALADAGVGEVLLSAADDAEVGRLVGGVRSHELGQVPGGRTLRVASQIFSLDIGT